eukprot:1141830-Pelagomonas_calceolata.AAC.3
MMDYGYGPYHAPSPALHTALQMVEVDKVQWLTLIMAHVMRPHLHHTQHHKRWLDNSHADFIVHDMDSQIDRVDQRQLWAIMQLKRGPHFVSGASKQDPEIHSLPVI